MGMTSEPEQRGEKKAPITTTTANKSPKKKYNLRK